MKKGTNMEFRNIAIIAGLNFYRLIFTMALILGAALMTLGCGKQEANVTGSSGNIRVQGAMFLKTIEQSSLVSCSIENPCKDSKLECAVLDLNHNGGAYCVDPNQICQQTGCTSGVCLSLQSYPTQIFCAIPAGPPGPLPLEH